MGIIDKIKQQNIAPVPKDELNVRELEFLLLLIKTNVFRGEDVELVYNTVLKLQNQYVEKQQK